MPTHQTITSTEAAAKSLSALLTSIKHPPSAAAVVAFKAAITRHGRQIAAAGGTGALTAVLIQLAFDAPDDDTAERRERIVQEAWAGIATSKGAAA